jgi:hypothetical protein
VPKGRRIVPSLVIDSAGQFRVRKIYCEREKRATVQKSSDKREIGAACERVVGFKASGSLRSGLMRSKVGEESITYTPLFALYI